MSLNGDMLVMRSGRSTSQISVYNYPEHLNPFYEDDQHKRLRFWKINKQNGNEGRRNSFSISNLKDMWAFKSFKMKKKSSTLGINKTSESPPPLRRDINLSSNGYNTFDIRHSRYSTNATNNANQFERNASYRTSLQNVSSSPQYRDNGVAATNGFERNNKYRSTIQFSGTTTMPQQRRPSQSSLISSNPFDTDDEDIITDTSLTGNSLSKVGTRTPRKKRLAPKPPITMHKLNSDESTAVNLSTESSQSNSQNERLRIVETNEIAESNNIASLTAEIESYVKTKTFESPIQNRKNVDTSITKKKYNAKHPQGAEIKITENQNGRKVTEEMITKNQLSTTPVNVSMDNNREDEISEVTNHLSTAPVNGKNYKISEEKITTNHLNTAPVVFDLAPAGNVECIHVHVDSLPLTKPLRTERSRVTSFQPDLKLHDQTKTAKPPAEQTLLAPENNTLPKTASAEGNNSNLCELKITEDATNAEFKIENITSTSLTPEQENSNIMLTISEQQKESKSADPQVKVVCSVKPEAAIKSSLLPKYQHDVKPKNLAEPNLSNHQDNFNCEYRVKVNPNLEWKKSTLAPLEENVPREKRKSVKDIIESINRSQRLLKVGAQKDNTHIMTSQQTSIAQVQQVSSEPNNNLSKQKQNLNENSTINLEKKEFFEEAAGMAVAATHTVHHYDNDVQQKVNNADVFKKCRVNKEVFDYRETSPTSSNLDWNPLPKPKRARNPTDA